MNSYEFEVAAKNVVIDMLAKRGIKAKIEDLQLVWFTHLLGNKKCMIYGEVMRTCTRKSRTRSTAIWSMRICIRSWITRNCTATSCTSTLIISLNKKVWGSQAQRPALQVVTVRHQQNEGRKRR